LFIKNHGEKQDSVGSAADNWLQTDLKTVSNSYGPEDVFYKTKQDFRSELLQIYKNAAASAGKKFKDRITVLLLEI
jgi:hypothetical protein